MRGLILSDKNFLFSETYFDRATKIRENITILNQLVKNPETKHILLWQGKILFDFSSDTPCLALIGNSHKFWRSSDNINIEHGSFVGFQEKKAIFYHNVPDWNEEEVAKLKITKFFDDSRNFHPALPKNYAFSELRSMMTIITRTDATILASIKGIYEWNKVNNFCSKCGSKISRTQSGWEKKCYTCDTKHFPRTDPVVIMMIYHKDKALLGRSPVWPKGMFSCLAGFMEPGESIESAVERETLEETGIIVKNTRYVTSQPWPFPASLMIGCMAEAKSHSIEIDKDEIEDARWFSKKEILEAINSKGAWWPAREGSIARFLIRQWVSGKI